MRSIANSLHIRNDPILQAVHLLVDNLCRKAKVLAEIRLESNEPPAAGRGRKPHDFGGIGCRRAQSSANDRRANDPGAPDEQLSTQPLAQIAIQFGSWRQ